MIGLGAKYLTAAGFGRYRITAASLGSAKVIWPEWLTAATKQAIMAAFGVDGTAVIAATNEYLNGIAASDKAKATALAGFINEDPMMVCSLGLEPQGVTMPWRLVWNSGTAAWIETGMTYAAGYKITHRYNDASGSSLNGVLNSMAISWGGRNNYYALMTPSGVTSTGVAKDDNVHVMTIESGKQTFDGVQFATITAVGDTHNFPLSAQNAISAGRYWTNYQGKHAEFIFERNGQVLQHLIPMKLGKAWAAEDVSTGVAQAAGTCGMIDLVSGKFFPNANSQGSFTIPDISYTPTT
jgi:hypothetical protein